MDVKSINSYFTRSYEYISIVTKEKDSYSLKCKKGALPEALLEAMKKDGWKPTLSKEHKGLVVLDQGEVDLKLAPLFEKVA
jgi:hypothetical protein